MTVQKKIMISNIVATMITALIILALCIAYVHFHSDTLPDEAHGSPGGISRLTKFMNILYTYESEISDMNWETILSEDEAEVLLQPEMERIEELQNLGYHIQVESPDRISFSNMDPSDRAMMVKLGDVPEKACHMTHNSIVVRDRILFDQKEWYVTAVYNEDRVDQGVQSSVTPMYMVPRGIGISFFLITLVCVAAVSNIYSRQISRMVLGRLERLTGSLSILVKMDTGGRFLHLETVNLDEYIKQFLTEKEAWLADRKVAVSYKTQAPEAEASLDIREMQRVFMNLLENTVRYRTAESSKAEIEVRQNTESVEIKFTDDGPGVSRRHLEHLFDPFYRADKSRTTPERGSGVGLAIVEGIIEGQGGHVRASSENGLCITMTLPAVKGENKDAEDTDR